jgi:predicted TIM-barrel fold metal-dependent hydrolase
MFGSDYPMLRPDAWLEAWELFDTYFCPLCNREESVDAAFKEAVVSGNARRMLGNLL